MPAGRPPIFTSPDEMQRIIDLYYLACNLNNQGLTDDEKRERLEGRSEADIDIVMGIEESVPLVSGLAYTLGMSTEGLRNYGTQDEFSATVKRAKQRIEMSLEQRLAGNNVTGSIFNLKNNFQWKDKTEVENNGSVNITMDVRDAETL